MTEKEKMKAGLWYDANNDQELIDQRLICQDLCFALNQLKPSDEKRNEIIEKILGYFPENLVLLSPFTADYGKNIKLGKNVFVNINNYFMDGATIEIGDNVFIGPADTALTLIFSFPKFSAKYLTLDSNAALAIPITLYPSNTFVEP